MIMIPWFSLPTDIHVAIAKFCGGEKRLGLPTILLSPEAVDILKRPSLLAPRLLRPNPPWFISEPDIPGRLEQLLRHGCTTEPDGLRTIQIVTRSQPPDILWRWAFGRCVVTAHVRGFHDIVAFFLDDLKVEMTHVLGASTWGWNDLFTRELFREIYGLARDWSDEAMVREAVKVAMKNLWFDELRDVLQKAKRPLSSIINEWLLAVSVMDRSIADIYLLLNELTQVHHVPATLCARIR